MAHFLASTDRASYSTQHTRSPHPANKSLKKIKKKQDAALVLELMQKYDTNKSGKLEEGQLALMLKDLNGGEEVTKVGTNMPQGNPSFPPPFLKSLASRRVGKKNGRTLSSPFFGGGEWSSAQPLARLRSEAKHTTRGRS